MDGKTREESNTTEAMIAFSVALSHSFFSRDGLCHAPKQKKKKGERARVIKESNMNIHSYIKAKVKEIAMINL
jgi:hypothetical protein